MVRPSIKRLARWGFPTLLLIVLWQIWDGHEARLLKAETDRVRSGERQPDFGNYAEPSAGRYYVAAGALILSTTTYPSHPAPLPASINELLPEMRDAIATGAALSEPLRAASRAVLERNEDAFRLIDRAATIAAFAYPSEQPISLGNVESGYSVATLDAIASDKLDAAADGMISRVQIVRVLDARPGSINALLRRSIFGNVVQDLGLLLGRGPVSHSRRDRIDSLLAEHDTENDLERTIRGDSVGVTRYAARIGNLGGDGFSLWRPVWRHQYAAILRVAQDCFVAAAKPWPEPLSAMEQVRGEEGSRLFRSIPTPAMMADGCRRMTRVLAQSAALIRSARVALAVDSYRTEHSRLPDALSDLPTVTGGGFADPFTGRPLVYRRREDGFSVYSLGENGKDDGGAVIPRPRVSGEAMRPSADVGITVTMRTPR